MKGFNSSMVRLKGPRPRQRRPHRKGFNSSMVRLKVFIVLQILPGFHLFQFQYGTIKSFQVGKEY